jgi:glutathione-regulated potassium-efflux system ancillary protein KefG
MPRILVNVFHPDLANSTGNKVLSDSIQGVANVTLRDLYREYPDMKIDVEREQHLLLDHDLIVFQHPLYWYSSPALFKEWQDRVLQPGFAFPPGVGDELKGKHWLSVITMASSGDEYGPDGANQYTLDEFLRPFERTAAFCGMTWVPPVIIEGVVQAKVVDARRIVAEHLSTQAEKYRLYLAGYDYDNVQAVTVAKRCRGND